MMFNFHKDHKGLVRTAVAGFAFLSMIVAVIPAYQMQDVAPLPGQSALNQTERGGLQVFISEGCVACHTQQVRNIEMDQIWGSRPSIPSDYYYSKQRLDLWRQSPSLLGSERTGPDLTNIGNRQPGREWHLLHLYNPRTVVKASIMPSYPWLFEEKDSIAIGPEDVVVPVGGKYFNKSGKKIVAGDKVLQLVTYLQSLKQAQIPDGTAAGFIPSTRTIDQTIQADDQLALPDGNQLYIQTCAACHQENGQGLPGAFPPLAGSSVVNDADPELMIRIILQGYDARTEYAQMPSFAEQLTDAQIAAIVNHERSSWGNEASAVDAALVGSIREFITNINQ
ncbi:MAG: cbb3-type cytochrome c oxidase subunit II [Saprospiraceae bacterium]|nr:cytochrome c [Lewinella sp.]